MSDPTEIRQLLDEYLSLYSARDERVVSLFAEDCTGFTGGGPVPVRTRDEWAAVTRQDFAQIKAPIRIEVKQVDIQVLADTAAMATSVLQIHLPLEDSMLSREPVRLVVVFRKEALGWKIAHSSTSVPYPFVRKGEIYPLEEVLERNRLLEEQTSERTRQLFDSNEALRRTNAALAHQIAENAQTSERLREREASYRSILNASPDSISIADLEARLLMASPAAVTMFGFDSVEQGLGHSLLEFIAPEDRQRAISTLSGIARGLTKGPAEYRAVRRDGSRFDIEVNSDLIRDCDGRPEKIVAIVRDVTARKTAEAALRESEEKYRTLVERANEAIIILQDGAFAFANRKTGLLLGVPTEELVGRPILDFIWPDDRERLAANHARRIAGDAVPSDYDFRLIGEGGRETWVFLSASLIQWKGRPATLNLLTDITDRRRSEDELRRATEQIRTLRGLLPICMDCKQVRDSQGRWSPIEVYVRERTEAEFSHGLCPDCFATRYPDSAPSDSDEKKTPGD